MMNQSQVCLWLISSMFPVSLSRLYIHKYEGRWRCFSNVSPFLAIPQLIKPVFFQVALKEEENKFKRHIWQESSFGLLLICSLSCGQREDFLRRSHREMTCMDLHYPIMVLGVAVLDWFLFDLVKKNDCSFSPESSQDEILMDHRSFITWAAFSAASRQELGRKGMTRSGDAWGCRKMPVNACQMSPFQSTRLHEYSNPGHTFVAKRCIWSFPIVVTGFLENRG